MKPGSPSTQACHTPGMEEIQRPTTRTTPPDQLQVEEPRVPITTADPRLADVGAVVVR